MKTGYKILNMSHNTVFSTNENSYASVIANTTAWRMIHGHTSALSKIQRYIHSNYDKK